MDSEYEEHKIYQQENHIKKEFVKFMMGFKKVSMDGTKILIFPTNMGPLISKYIAKVSNSTSVTQKETSGPKTDDKEDENEPVDINQLKEWISSNLVCNDAEPEGITSKKSQEIAVPYKAKEEHDDVGNKSNASGEMSANKEDPLNRDENFNIPDYKCANVEMSKVTVASAKDTLQTEGDNFNNTINPSTSVKYQQNVANDKKKSDIAANLEQENVCASNVTTNATLSELNAYDPQPIDPNNVENRRTSCNQSKNNVPKQNSYVPQQNKYPLPHTSYSPSKGNYAAPPGNYATPQSNYSPPQGSYVALSGNYVPPQGNYVPSPGNYASPQGYYQPSQGNYLPPQSNYAPPQGNFAALPGNYASPQGYYAPRIDHFRPLQNYYGAPQNGYIPPVDFYGNPRVGYMPIPEYEYYYLTDLSAYQYEFYDMWPIKDYIIELYDFPRFFNSIDLLSIYTEKPRYIKWCDENHALLVTSSCQQAYRALHIYHPWVKSRPMSIASRSGIMTSIRYLLKPAPRENERQSISSGNTFSRSGLQSQQSSTVNLESNSNNSQVHLTPDTEPVSCGSASQGSSTESANADIFNCVLNKPLSNSDVSILSQWTDFAERKTLVQQISDMLSSKVTVVLASNNYDQFQTEELKKMGHIIEIFNIPRTFTEDDLLNIYSEKPSMVVFFELTGAILITGSVEQAERALKSTPNCLKSRPLVEASLAAVALALEFFLVPLKDSELSSKATSIACRDKFRSAMDSNEVSSQFSNLIEEIGQGDH